MFIAISVFVLIIVATLVLGVVLGVLIGRNNSSKVEKIVQEAKEAVDKIHGKVEEIKDRVDVVDGKIEEVKIAPVFPSQTEETKPAPAILVDRN